MGRNEWKKGGKESREGGKREGRKGGGREEGETRGTCGRDHVTDHSNIVLHGELCTDSKF